MLKRLILLFSFLIGIVLIQGVTAQDGAGYRPKSPNHPNALPAWTQPLDISGRTATATIRGRVYRADGTTPLIPGEAGVQVEDAFTGQYLVGVGLNPDGTYTAPGIPAGTYFVRASGDNFALQYYDDAGYTNANATPIVVTDDQTVSDIDFALDEGGQVTGTIYQDDGMTPLPNVPVRVADDILLVACSDSNGDFTMKSLPLDVPLRLYAGGANNCGGSGEYVIEYWEEANAYANATPITLTAADSIQADVDFTLAFGGSIAGTVFNAAGTARLNNILVTAEDADTGAFVRETTTNANGEYTLQGLASGDYRVRAEGALRVIEYYDEAGFNGNTATRVTVNLQETTEGIDFTLANGGQVKGTVSTAAGIPLSNINVALSDDIWASTCSDVNGKFTLSGLPLDMELHVYAGGQNYCNSQQLFVREWWEEAARLNLATPVVIPANNPVFLDINFTLVEGGSISGMVYEADGSTPVSGDNVEVVVSDLGAAVEVARGFVSADGSYKIPALPAGTYAVFAKGTGYAMQFYDNGGIMLASATPVSVAVDSNTAGIDFALAKSGNVVGTVRDADSNMLLPNVVVGVEGAAWLATCTNATGQYTLANIPRDLPVKIFAGNANCAPGLGDYAREWWQEKASAATADAITLTATQSTKANTNFTLAKGNRVFIPIVKR